MALLQEPPPEALRVLQLPEPLQDLLGDRIAVDPAAVDAGPDVFPSPLAHLPLSAGGGVEAGVEGAEAPGALLALEVVAGVIFTLLVRTYGPFCHHLIQVGLGLVEHLASHRSIFSDSAHSPFSPFSNSIPWGPTLNFLNSGYKMIKARKPVKTKMIAAKLEPPNLSVFQNV